jgi:hypothetical protein
MAVSQGGLPAARILLDAGADHCCRNNYESPREMAEQAGLTALRATYETRRKP